MFLAEVVKVAQPSCRTFCTSTVKFEPEFNHATSSSESHDHSSTETGGRFPPESTRFSLNSQSAHTARESRGDH